MEKKLALLIDADNISPKYVDPILDELIKYGTVTYKRIYGDWTSNQKSSWKEALLTHSISPIQQFSYTNGKNATDSAMIIDAMDILYTSHVDGFCIVSSDSDFTRLASRIRESGLLVIGMGEKKTPIAFRKACDVFTNLELLLEDQVIDDLIEEPGSLYVNEEGKGRQHKGRMEREFIKNERELEKQSVHLAMEQIAVTKQVIDKSMIENVVIRIISENENKDKTTTLGEVGSRLLKLYPDFDVRSYGYSLLSKLLEEFTKIKLIKSGHSIIVTLLEDQDVREQVEEYIIQRLQKSGEKGMELSELGNLVHKKYRKFKVRDYGYSQFKKFVRQIPSIRIRDIENIPRVYVV